MIGSPAASAEVQRAARALLDERSQRAALAARQATTLPEPSRTRSAAYRLDEVAGAAAHGQDVPVALTGVGIGAAAPSMAASAGTKTGPRSLSSP